MVHHKLHHLLYSASYYPLEICNRYCNTQLTHDHGKNIADTVTYNKSRLQLHVLLHVDLRPRGDDTQQRLMLFTGADKFFLFCAFVPQY